MSNPFEKYVQASQRQTQKLSGALEKWANTPSTPIEAFDTSIAGRYADLSKPITPDPTLKSAGDLLVDAAASALKIPTIVGGVAVGAADLALSAASKPIEGYMRIGNALAPNLIPEPMDVGYGYIAKGLHDTIGYRPEEAKAFIDEKLFSDARKIQEKEYQSGYTAAEDKAFQDSWVSNYQAQVANLQKAGATEQQLKDFNTGFDKQYQEAATQRADKYQTSWDKPLSENIDIIGHGFDNLLENPSLALGGAIESAGYLLPSMAVSRGVMALEKAANVAKIGRVAAAEMAGKSIGELAITRSPFLAAGIGEGSVSGLTVLEQMRSQMPDGIAGGRELLGALGVAASTGLIGTGFGKAASKFGIGDIDAAELGRAASQVAAMKLPALARPVGAIAQEGSEEFLQTFGESIIPNVTMGKDPLEGLGQELPMGTMAGAIMGAGMNAPSLVTGGFSDISSGLGKVKGAVSDAANLKSFDTLSNPEHKNYNPAQAFDIQLKNLESNDETVRTQAEASVSKIGTDLDTARASVEERIKSIQATLKAMPTSDQTTDAQKLEIEALGKEYSELTTKSSTLADQYVAFLDAQVAAQEHRDVQQGTQFTEEQAKADIATLTQPIPSQTVWSNQDTDIPVEVIGEPEVDEQGNEFTKVRYTPQEGGDPVESYVPTSELVSTEGTNDVAQQEALDRVTRHFSKYSNDDLDLLATSPVLNEQQRNSLRLMSKSKRELAAIQDPSQVFDNILNGYKGKTIRESHRGLNQYTDMVNTAVATKNTQLADLALNGLGAFTDDHIAKRDAINEAFGLVQNGTYKEVQVVRTQDGTWGMVPFTAQEVRAGKNADGVAFLEGKALKAAMNKVGGFNVHINSNSTGAISQVNNETQLIQDRFNALSGVAESFVGVTPKPVDASTAPTVDSPIVAQPSDTTAPVDNPAPEAPVQSGAPATPTEPIETVADSEQQLSSLTKTASDTVKLPSDYGQSDIFKAVPLFKKENPTGIIAFRVNSKRTLLESLKDANAIGNPFNWQNPKIGAGNATKMFDEWLRTGKHTDHAEAPQATEEYRQAILSKLKENPTAKILYYKELNGASHANVLEHIAKGMQQTATPTETKTPVQAEVTTTPSQDTSEVGFKLTTTGQYTSKDQLKADKATKFIGEGAANSSTAQYAKDAGDKANTGKYTKNDVVFISVNGARANRQAPNLVEIQKAIDAGATILTDKLSDRERSFNVGEREVAAHLTKNGYVEEGNTGVWKPQAETADVTEGVNQVAGTKQLAEVLTTQQSKASDVLTELKDSDSSRLPKEYKAYLDTLLEQVVKVFPDTLVQFVKDISEIPKKYGIEEFFFGKQGTFNDEKFVFIRQVEKTASSDRHEVTVHEFIHVATADYIENKFSGTQSKTVRSLLDAARAYVRTFKGKTTDGVKVLTHVLNKEGTYVQSKELLAYGLTHPALVAELQKIPYIWTSANGGIGTIASSMLEVVEPTNVYEALLVAYGNILEIEESKLESTKDNTTTEATQGLAVRTGNTSESTTESEPDVQGTDGGTGTGNVEVEQTSTESQEVTPLKPEFQGKVILAHAGTGKSFATKSNPDLIDGDVLYYQATNTIVDKYNEANNESVPNIENVTGTRGVFEAWGEYGDKAATKALESLKAVYAFEDIELADVTSKEVKQWKAVTNDKKLNRPQSSIDALNGHIAEIESYLNNKTEIDSRKAEAVRRRDEVYAEYAKQARALADAGKTVLSSSIRAELIKVADMVVIQDDAAFIAKNLTSAERVNQNSETDLVKIQGKIDKAKNAASKNPNLKTYTLEKEEYISDLIFEEPAAPKDAKVTVLQGVTDEIAAEERKKPFNLRNILKGYFTQSTTKEDATGANPLVTVANFIRNFNVRTQVSDWLNDRRKPTEKQLAQVEHFQKFHAEFAKALKFVFNTQASAIFVSNKENLVGYLEMGKKPSTRELDENVVTALALSAYSYLIKQGNKVMNTNEELETLFRLKKGMRAPLHIEQMFRFAGQEMPIVVKALGTDAAKALGLKVRADQDPTLQDRLNASLGILAMEAMAKAGFIVIETLQDHPTDEKNKPLTDFLTAIKAVRESKAHTIEDEYDFEVDTDAETQIKKFTMVRPNAKMEGIGNSVFEKGIIETTVDGKIIRTETLTLNRPVLTEGLPTLNSTLVNELIEANKDTKGFLSYLFGVDVGYTMPLKEMPKKFFQKLINGTDASVPSVQAELLTEAQKHSFTMRTNTVAVFAAMQKLGENSQFLKELLGIWIDDHVLSRTHVTERDSLQAKAQNDWTAVLNGLEWAEATLDEQGQYQEFYDTQFVAQNQRQHLKSNMFSAQSSQIHRAMAALTGFSTTIDLSQDEQGTVKDEALLNLFYQAVGEGLEGLDDYLKADILAKAGAGLHQFFTVDKVYGDYYVPALKAFLQTTESKNAIKAMRVLIETGTIDATQQKAIAWFVEKGDMGAQSLQSLIALAELDIAQANGTTFTTTIGFGSDGVNHGVSAANMLTGVISKDMRQQTGIFPIAEKGEDQIDNMQEVYRRGVTDYYVDFGKVMAAKLRDLIPTFVGKLNTDFVEGMQALFPKFEALDETGVLKNLLAMRKMAKIWAIPFNYSAGKAALQRALARGFLAGIYGEMNKLANEALDIIDAKKKEGLTAEQLAALDVKLDTVKLKTKTLEEKLNKVLGKYGMSVTLPEEPQLLNEEDKGKLSSDLEKTLMQAAIDLHGKAAWQATEEFAKEYLQVRNVYTEVEKASFTLFNLVRTQLIAEKRANRKYTNVAAKVNVKGKIVQYTAEELNAQEAEYFDLTKAEMAEVDAVLAAMRPMFNTALSVGSESTNDAGSGTNPSGVSVRKHKMQREPAKGLRAVNTYYLKEIDANRKPFSESRNIGLSKEVEENAGVASSANAIQSIDAFVAAKVQGFMDALNVHDAAIFGLKNFLKGVKKQNEEHLKALTNYQLGLEHAKMLVKVYVGYKAFMATQEEALKSEDVKVRENAQKLITEAKQQMKVLLWGEQMFKGDIALKINNQLVYKGGLIPKLQAANLDIKDSASIEEAISVFINFALKQDLQKLEVLLDTYSIHQFAGEGGMHQLTDENRASITEQEALVEKAKEDLQAELKGKSVEQVAEVKTPKDTKPVSVFISFLRSFKDGIVPMAELLDHLKNRSDIQDAGARAAQGEVLKAITPLLDANTKVVYSIEDYDGYGYFDEETNTLHINAAREDGVKTSLAVHELLHAVLSRRIKTLRNDIENKTGNNSEAVTALQRLDTLRERLLLSITDPVLRDMLKNTDEFISYGLTESRLQEAMKSTQVDRGGRTFSAKLRKFVEFVGQILGFRSKEISALAAFASDTAALLETIGSVTPVVAPNNGERLFSKNTPPSKGLTVASTRQILVKQFGEKLIKALEAKGLLRIVETMKGVPEAALKSIQAWHGSPHKFSSFSLAHLGTGEGNQAYGWGLYFAASKEVSEWYRTVLSEQQGKHRTHVTYDGIAYEFSEGSEHEAQALIRALVSKGHSFRDSLEAIMELRKYPRLAEVRKAFTRIVEGDSTRYTEAEIAKEDKFTKEVILKPRRILKILNEMSIDEGQLYKVNLDVIEEGLLLWDTPFEEQSKVVQQALLALGYKPKPKTKYLSLEEDGGSIYRDLAGTLGGQKEASLALKKNGVDGIKYLDGGSRKAGEGNYNYVVFDDAAIDVVETFYSKNPNGIEGYYHNGQATLVSENLSAETVVATLLHELSGHKGFQELMEPAAYNALMKQFDKLVAEGNPIALAALKRAQEATGSDGKPLTEQGQMDEYLPYLLTIQAAINATQAQKSAIAKFIDNVFSAVRAWAYKKLQANGYEGAASAFMQPQDIVYMAERMLREMANNPVTSSNTQSPIKFSTKSAEDLVNGQSSLDIMQALPHSNTGSFNQQLDRLITEEIGQLYNQDDAAKARIDEIQTLTASDALNAGFSLSRKEQYVQQALQYAVAAYMKLHAGGANVGQLNRVYHAAKAKMDATGKDFHEGDWATATQQEKDIAKAKYDFMFDSTKEGYMSRFVSMALASEAVNKLLDIALPLTKPDTQDKTWFEKVNDWVSYVMAWLTNKYVRLNPVAGASNQLVQLMDNLVKLDIRARQEGVALHQKAWNTIGLVTTPLNKALKGAGGALLSGVGLRDSRFLPVRALGAILVLRSEEAAKAIPKMIIDMRNNQNPNTKLGEVCNILLEASGVGTLRDKFDVLIRQTNLNAKNRQDIVDNVKKAVNTWFKAPLTKVQSKAIAYGLLGTDAQALLENYSVEDIVNMALHEGKLNAEIAKLKKEIAKNPNGNDMLNAAEQLGYYMVTRIGGEGLVKNATGIAIGLGTQYFTSVEQADPKLVGQLNTLVSMLAMTHVPNSDKAILAALYKTDAEGIHATIQLHNGLVNDSLKDFQANPLNMVKGWMPEVTNPYLEIKAANSMVERQQMEAEGWVLIDELKRDKHDKGSPKYLMKHNDIGYQRLVSGAVDLGSTARSGTEAISRTSPKYLGITQARYQNAARRAAIPNSSFDPSKQPRGLIAAYDTDGVALGFNYEMDNETRDAHLDRKHNIGDLLGTFGGLNYYKPEKAKQSNKVAEVLFEDYKANYSQNPNAYLKISPKSTDPKVVEMWRMLPQDFRQRATELYGKGNPIIIRNEAFNLAFGFKKFSVVSYAFDAVKAERERIKNGLVGTGKSPNAFQSGFVRLAEATRGNTAQADFAKAEHVTQEIVKAIKDFIVIRSGTTMMWNIFANVLMLMANGINPVTIIKDWVFAVTNVRAYQKLNSQLIQAQADLAGGKDPIALKQRIGALKAELKANVMNPYINAGLLSSIVEDVNIQQGEYTYASAFKQTVDEKTQWIPKPVKTAAAVLTIAPSTKLYQFLATTTQLSDFVAKYSMSKHLQANGTDIDASIIEASKTFINYDVPTSQGLQYANDMGLFMFTKFFLRIQAVLMKLLGKRAGSTIAQHILVESLTGAEGILSPSLFNHIDNIGIESSVLGLPSAFFSIGTVDAVTDFGVSF